MRKVTKQICCSNNGTTYDLLYPSICYIRVYKPSE